jgi:hypothetical protein
VQDSLRMPASAEGARRRSRGAGTSDSALSPRRLLAWMWDKTCPLAMKEWAVKRQLLVLGAGTAGTMIVNKLRRKLDVGRVRWSVEVVPEVN